MKSIIILAAAALVGCASNSGVVPMGQGVYTVSRQAATGSSGSGTLKAEALAEAGRHCAEQRRELLVTNITEAQPPFLLGNFPKAEVQFKCV